MDYKLCSTFNKDIFEVKNKDTNKVHIRIDKKTRRVTAVPTLDFHYYKDENQLVSILELMGITKQAVYTIIFS